MPQSKKSSDKINVNVTLPSQAGQPVPAVRIYLFDDLGALAQSAAVGDKAASFTIAPDRRYRLVVGPDLAVDQKTSAELAAELADAGAISSDVIPQVPHRDIQIQVPHGIYGCWWQTCILVHGSVRKQTAPGVYATICDGVVQIFQVDLACTLDRLASFTDAPAVYQLLIDAMGGLERELYLQRLRLIPNLPDPPPDFHATRVVGDTAREIRTSQAATGTPAVNRVARMAARSAMPQTALNAASVAELAASMNALPPGAIKSAILANKALIAPFLCELIPDAWFCWQELGEATIQSDGTFSAEICFWCPADFPDLYFEVVQTVDGLEREISDPQIACSTYYDYDGSQDVVITVDDPAAVACNNPQPRPIPGDEYYVWPNAIGNQDLRGINGLEDPPASGAPQGQLGTQPWGGTLALQMEFDPRLLSDGVANYYRWSYRFDGDAAWSPINAPVVHRYKTVSYPPLQIHLHNYPLGPQTVGSEQNLFEVPPATMGDGWVNINDPADRPLAYFDSTDNHHAPWTTGDSLPRRSGTCTLMLELFDSSGNLVSCSNNGLAGSFVFVLPDLNATPNDYTSVLGPNNITPQGQLVFRVLVDNNDTFASLDSVTAGGNTADLCGILHYSDVSKPVDIAFRATHPNNYLTWGLGISRGTYGGVASESGNSSSPPQPQNPLERTAQQLLGTCTSAAFAVNLGTYATATDGYGRQSQYDRSATIAFALLNP